MIRVSYEDAVRAARTDATYADTLLACAMPRVDELGYFAAPDLQAPLSMIAGRQRPTSSFNQHLKRSARGLAWTLETLGEERVPIDALGHFSAR